MLQPETREMFMKAVEGLRAAGATVVFDETILRRAFSSSWKRSIRNRMLAKGLKTFSVTTVRRSITRRRRVRARGRGLRFRHSFAARAGGGGGGSQASAPGQRRVETDPDRRRDACGSRSNGRAAAYHDALDHLQLDGMVYPAVSMPPNDELLPLLDGRRSSGPHSQTGWVNPIGIPAIVVPGGFYASGLPFGLELSARQWKDGDLIGWAFAYEQATKHRKPPTLRDKR